MCLCVCVWQFVSICVGTTQTISLSVLARNPHKGLKTRSPMRPEVEEGRKVREKTERERERERERESEFTTAVRREQSA